jgi:hypothetical protein
VTPETFDLDDWGVVFPGDSCGLYNGTYAVYDSDEVDPVQDITRDRVARVDAAHVKEGDCSETNLTLLVELTDGTWAACMAWCDTTGWDCGAGVQWKWGRTRDEVIRQGLDRGSRRLLGVPLEGEEATTDA